MKTFFVTVLLGCALSLTSAQSCSFPNSGNGGVLDESNNYINGSVLVWVDVANNCFDYVNADDDIGVIALNSWIDASNTFDTAMATDDLKTSFDMLYQANESFETVAPQITKPELSAYFTQVHSEFGDLLDEGDLILINDYMINAYPIFKQKLGC